MEKRFEFIENKVSIGKKGRGWVLLGLVFLLSCGETPAQVIEKIGNPLIVGGNRPMTIAHRGGAGEYPEETLLAFTHAAREGIDYLEMDVRLTADDHLVLHHDSLIERTSDGFGKVAEIGLEELRGYNFANNFTNDKGKYPYRSPSRAQRILTVDEIFQEFPDYKMIMEIKDSGARGELSADLLYRSIVKHGKQKQVIVASFHDDVLDSFRHISGGEMTTMAGQKESLWFYFAYLTGIDSLYQRKSDLLALPISFFGIDLTRKEIIAYAHLRNLAVHYWTINDSETMERLIVNGADGIMSDYPRLMKETIHP